jgi:hypothetical protein
VEEGAFGFGAGAVRFEECPGCGPQAFGVIGQRNRVPLASALDPFSEHARRRALVRHANLVGHHVLARHFVVVERAAEAVADARLGIVQNRMAHQPAAERQVNVLDAPHEHMRVEPVQLVVQLARHRKRAADKRRRFVKLAPALANGLQVR